MKTYPDLVGMVFKEYGKSSYWKITKKIEKKPLVSYVDLYSVIKCSKTGKEFEYTNSFTATYVHSLYDAGLLFKATSNEDVSTANKEEGKKKRRIKYLKSKIQELIKELNTLEGN